MPLDRQGLVFLSGLNGHGKSTPFEVLQHILFGTTSRGIKKDHISCAVPTSDGFLGEVILRNPDGRWLIRQSRNHSRYKTIVKVYREVDGRWSLSWDGGGCPKKLEDAQKLAGSLLGLQQHEFSGCMYLSQSGAHTLIEGTPSDKMRYIAQLFGLDVCDRMVDWLRRKLKEAEAEIVDAPVLEAEHARLTDEVAGYDRPGQHDIQIVDDALKASAEHKQYLRGIIYWAREQLATARQREAVVTERQALGEVGRHDELKARVGRLHDKRDKLRDLLRGLRQRDELQERLDRLEAVPKSIEQLDIELKSTHHRLTSAKMLAKDLQERARIEAALAQMEPAGELAALQSASDDVTEKRTAAALKLKEKQQQIDQLHVSIAECVDGTCPTCMQPLDLAAMKKMLRRAESEVGGLQAVLDEATSLVGQLGGRLLIAQQRDEYERALTSLLTGDLGELRGQIDRDVQLADQLSAKRLVAAEAAMLRRQLAELPDGDVESTEKRLTRTEALLTGMTAEVDRAARAETLDRQLADLAGADVDEEERKLDLAEKGEAILESCDVGLRDRQVRIEMACRQYDGLVEDLEAAKQQLDAIAEPRRRVHVLRYAVAATQKLKRRQLHRVVESIRDCLPRFASTMFSHEPNTRFVVAADEESLDLVCRRTVSHQAVNIPVKSMSGGEKQRLSVALVFTLHALLHARKRPDLLILDEVDRGLDDVGIASLMSLVRSVREQYGTVIMTSHRSQIAGAAFDRTWQVTKLNEESRLTTDGGSGC